MKKSIKHEFFLLFVAIAWGVTTVLNKTVMIEISPLWTITLRMMVASIALVLLYWKRLKTVSRKTILRAIILSIVLEAMYLFALYGVNITSASNGGVLTCLSCILIPVIELVAFRRKISIKEMLCIIIMFVGIWLLGGGITSSLNFGDILCIFCSLFCAIHIILADKWMKDEDPAIVNLIQLFGLFVMSLILALLIDDFTLPKRGITWISILILGVFCSALAFHLQLLSQKYIESVKAGLILGMEPIFGTLSALIFWHEILTLKAYIAIILMICATIVVQLPGFEISKNKEIDNNG